MLAEITEFTSGVMVSAIAFGGSLILPSMLRRRALGRCGRHVFLFTDVVGSTAMWRRDPERMDAALARHDRVVERAVRAHAGRVFCRAGDSFAVRFGTVAEAVAAATQIREKLAATPGSQRLEVRMGIHAGPATRRRGNYYGLAVSAAARIADAAGPGEVLISADAGALDPSMRVGPARRVTVSGDDHTMPAHRVEGRSVSPQVASAWAVMDPAG
jgi:class 3 adenylate cyclase